MLTIILLSKAYPQKKSPTNPIPNKAQLAWQEAELGAVFHYDLHVFDNKKYRQTGTSGNRINPIAERIHQLYPIEVEELKLEINQKILPPIIKQFSVY